MEQDDKKIEDLVNKLMADDRLERAPLGFTDEVMARVEALSSSNVSVYKPLIPKSVWVFIFSAVIALIAYMYFKNPTTNSNWFEKLGLSDIAINNPFENLTINFSATVMYSIVLFAVMLCIQIPVLKHYFNNRMSF